jgi:hypothetical protein
LLSFLGLSAFSTFSTLGAAAALTSFLPILVVCVVDEGEREREKGDVYEQERERDTIACSTVLVQGAG